MKNPVLETIRNEYGFAAKLAKRLGITRSAVWMWDKQNKVPPRHAFRVASFMNLPVTIVCPELMPEPMPPSRKRRKSGPRKR